MGRRGWVFGISLIRAVPTEIEEAAAIDGASRLGVFFRVVNPLSCPGVVTVGILGFIARIRPGHPGRGSRLSENAARNRCFERFRRAATP